MGLDGAGGERVSVMANHPDFTDFPFELRKLYSQVEEIYLEGGEADGEPLLKVAVAAIIRNPHAGRFGEDLTLMIDSSVMLGQLLGDRMTLLIGDSKVQSYGKAALVGVAGQQEHANALISTTFATPMRSAVGGGKAWISSNSKRVAPGTLIDVPLAHKDALYVRDNYDTVEVRIPDAPLPDEIVVIFVAATRGRLNARCGGLKAAAIKGENGLL